MTTPDYRIHLEGVFPASELGVTRYSLVATDLTSLVTSIPPYEFDVDFKLDCLTTEVNDNG